MMYGHEKSDSVIVAVKPANKAANPAAEQSAARPAAAESVERRAGTKGNADQQSTCRTQSRVSVSQALERIRQDLCRHIPEVGAVCGKAACTDLCGGRAMKRASLPLLHAPPVHLPARRRGGGVAGGNRAQQRTMPVVGFLRSASLADSMHLVTAFRLGLKDEGFVEGQNIAVEYHAADGQPDRLRTLVAELLRRPVAVIVANQIAALAAKAATTTVPIVFTSGSDPVEIGLVASLNRPGGNVTGVSFLVGGAWCEAAGVAASARAQGDNNWNVGRPKFVRN